uniref:Hypothetical secreted protein n=1 Tax=uncultured planctomycete 3FN TaxID=455066 RepID=A9LGX8_9BACT|nr:hypothetical secreted protein [uncultured planctomycete 3FN]
MVRIWHLGNSAGVRTVVCGLIVGLTALAPAWSAAPTRTKKRAEFTTGSSDVLISFIDQQVRQGWDDSELKPSPVAADAEWLRRVHLDIAGTIPPAAAIQKFLADKDKAKRSKVIEKLLDDEGYVRNWSTVWTNLLIGQQPQRRISRPGMQKFLREAFGRNRPWDKVVYDLVTAEGHFEENGAVNYMLASIPNNNDAGATATARTTRLFMGVQVQCTQCHNHPFNDWQMDQFWEFNSFFRQMRRVDHRKYDEKTGRMVDDFSEVVFNDFSGPVYYEKRSGLMQVAYPKYFKEPIDPGDGIHRRQELGKMMIAGDKPYIAQAMVNRMWGHFFGYGFTKPVDDMGPHSPPTHPELLDRLSVEFVKSGYDLKQLIRWICNSEAYNLTSVIGSKNSDDNPGAGESPMFTHLYIKHFTAEQLYNSLIVATSAHKSGRTNWDAAEKQRQQWSGQFVTLFGTGDNDLITNYNGSIPQALVMMNGDLIKNATNGKAGSFLNAVVNSRDSDAEKVRQLYLATLSRLPSRTESGAATKMLKSYPDRGMAYQDLFWALLNCNEFVMNH